MFRLLSQTDPLLLLFSDVTTVDDDDKRLVATTLLEFYELGRLVDLLPQQRRRLSKLRFEGLADVLRPYISGKNANRFARRTAVDIAEACGVAELQEALLEVALDPDESDTLRAEAVMALSRIGNEASKARLAELVVRQGHDIDRELLGGLLIATWPGLLSAEMVFELLTEPEDMSLMGLYWLFVSDRLAPGLDEATVQVALSWLDRQPSLHSLSYLHQRFANAIVARAFDLADNADVMAGLAATLASRLRQYEDFDLSPMMDDSASERRRLLGLAMLMRLRTDEAAVVGLVREGLFTALDLDWLLERLQSTQDALLRAQISTVVRLVLNVRDGTAVLRVLTVAEDLQELRAAIAPLLGPVRLDSDDVKWMRQVNRPSPPSNEETTLDTRRRSQIESLLSDSESGELAAWWKLCVFLAEGGSEFDTAITDLPTWNQLDESLKQRTLAAAARYIEEAPLEPTTWMKPRIVDRPAFAGLKALVLLLGEMPGIIDSIHLDRWTILAPLILWYSSVLASSDEPPVTQLLRRACTVVPLALHAAAPQVLAAELVSSEADPTIFARLGECWDGRAQEFTRMAAEDVTNELRVTRAALQVLARRAPDVAIEVGLRHIDARRFGSESFSRAVDAARILLQEEPARVWSYLWPEMRDDRPFGEAAFLSVSSRDAVSPKTLVHLLPESEIAALYIWLDQTFQREDDPNPLGAHVVTPRESVARLRDQILQAFRDKGTIEALESLRTIAASLPDEEWIHWMQIEAETAYRRENWSPIRPSHLVELAERSQLRFVEDGAGLLAVLIESLGRLQLEMRGETPSVRALWNETKSGASRKGEAALADFVKLHLKRDLAGSSVIVNREVQIRGMGTSATGEVTDIHVDAIQGAGDHLIAIIEVKGDWHPELLTAMKTQLVERYLVAEGVSAGLYLVGWFGASPFTFDELRSTLERQTASLESPALALSAVVLDARYR